MVSDLIKLCVAPDRKVRVHNEFEFVTTSECGWKQEYDAPNNESNDRRSGFIVE